MLSSIASSLSLLALATGVIASNGYTSKIVVSHNGPPTAVEIVGLDENYNEVEVKSFPGDFVATRNTRKTVTVELNPDVWAVCAKAHTKRVDGVRAYRSCVAVDVTKTEQKPGGIPLQLENPLRDALNGNGVTIQH